MIANAWIRLPHFRVQPVGPSRTVDSKLASACSLLRALCSNSKGEVMPLRLPKMWAINFPFVRNVVMYELRRELADSFASH